MNTKVVKKFPYAPALFTALALIATSECLAIGVEGVVNTWKIRTAVLKYSTGP